MNLNQRNYSCHLANNYTHNVTIDLLYIIFLIKLQCKNGNYILEMLKCTINGKWFKSEDEMTNLREHIYHVVTRSAQFSSVNDKL